VRYVAPAGRVLRVVSFLAVLGFLTVVLIGPVLALVVGMLSLILSLLLAAAPFVIVGLLVWGVYIAVSPERNAAWQRLRARVAGAGRWIVDVPLAACVRLCSWGLGVGRTLAPIAVPAARRAGEVAQQGVEAGVALAEQGAYKARSAFRTVAGVTLEVIGGAAVGTILVCLADSHVPGGILGLHILGGAITGAILGLLVGAARSSLRAERG